MKRYPFNLQKSPWMHAITAAFWQSADRKRNLAPLHRRRQSPRLRLERLELRNLLASYVEGFGGIGGETTNAFPSMDPSGNIYLTGQYNSQTADFDPGSETTNLTSVGGADAFAASYASDGSMIWARGFGGTYFNDDARASVYSSEQAGNYLYVTGIFSGTVNFGGSAGNLTSAGVFVDAFLVKLDATNGSTVWAKRIGGTSSTVPTDIAVTHDPATNTNKIHIAGRFMGTTDFDPGPGTVSLTPVGKGKNREFDGFLLTLDTDGKYGSVKQLGGSGSDNVSTIETDGTSLFLVGNVVGTVDLDPSVGVKNASGFFMAKYASSASAAPTWVQSTNDGAHVSGDGNALYVTGSSAAGATVVKHNKSDGAIVWSKQLGGVGLANTITDAFTGTLYVSGNFSSSVDFNPLVNGGELSSRGATDAFLLKLNAAGDFQQVWQIGGTGLDRARVIGFRGTTLYVSGFFEASADFPTGGTLNSSGDKDLFLMAFDQAVSAAPLLFNRNVSPDLLGKASVSVQGVVDPSLFATGLLQSGSKTRNQLAGSQAIVRKSSETPESKPVVSLRLATKLNNVDLAIAEEDFHHLQHTIADDLFELSLR